jgi:superfamily I DNA/RNA helicase
VLRDGVRLANIAAVTFTEKAGAELRDRLARSSRRCGDPTRTRRRAQQALDDLDGAAIGTLHSFAQRHSRTRDRSRPAADHRGARRSRSSVAFEAVVELQAALLDDDGIAQPCCSPWRWA